MGKLLAYLQQHIPALDYSEFKEDRFMLDFVASGTACPIAHMAKCHEFHAIDFRDAISCINCKHLCKADAIICTAGHSFKQYEIHRFELRNIISELTRYAFANNISLCNALERDV